MSDATQLPPAAVIVTHEVADWSTWKTEFDKHEGARKAAGILGHHINRGLDHPNTLSVYLAVSDLARAQAFTASPDLQGVMAAAGVKSVPTAVWVKPLTEHIVWDREMPAAMISHTVANLDTWLAGYTAAAAIQEQAGIAGQDIQPPKLFHRRCDQGVHRRPAGHIRRERKNPSALAGKFGGALLQFSRPGIVIQNHGGPFPDQHPGNPVPDAVFAGCAGDESYFLIQAHA